MCVRSPLTLRRPTNGTQGHAARRPITRKDTADIVTQLNDRVTPDCVAAAAAGMQIKTQNEGRGFEFRQG